VGRKGRFAFQEPFPASQFTDVPECVFTLSKLVFYRIKKIVISCVGKRVLTFKSVFLVTLISIHEDSDQVLRFWVDVEYEQIKKHVPGGTRTELIAQILRKFEEAGDAMRFLNG
jgi:hypothetical protein